MQVKIEEHLQGKYNIVVKRITLSGTPGGVGGGRGGDNTLRCFCENYNDIFMRFITHCCLLSACFSVGIVYVPVKKIILSVLTYNTQKLCRKLVYPGTKRPKLIKLYPNKKIGAIR